MLRWSSNFAQQLARSPGAFGVPAEAVASLVAAQQAFAQRYAASQSRQTRTPVSVRAKDAARAAMIVEVRPLAAMVRAQASTSNAQLGALGLRTRREVRREVARPGVAPLVRVVSAGGSPVVGADRGTGHGALPQARGCGVGGVVVLVRADAAARRGGVASVGA